MSNALTAPVGVKEVTLHEPHSGVMGIIERLASDPNFDTAKLEKLIELHERTQANAARAEFFRQFSVMQSEIPAIERKGTGDKGKKYARNEDIQRALRPILQRHGFMLSFATSFDGGQVRVMGKLAHEAGHVETAEFVSAADTSGSKNAIQALGSAQSYGIRYTTVALLNITGTDEGDDDGAAAGRTDIVAPEGFDDWWDDLGAAVDEGLAAYQAAWKAGTKAQQAHLAKHFSREHEERKRRAAKVAR